MSLHVEKTVYAPAAASDGLRLIIMRRYPRGVAKSRAHAWLPELAPSLPLVQWYHATLKALVEPAAIAAFWAEYRGKYLREMEAPMPRHLVRCLAALHGHFDLSLTLLCACADHRLCHRSLLAELILKEHSATCPASPDS